MDFTNPTPADTSIKSNKNNMSNNKSEISNGGSSANGNFNNNNQISSTSNFSPNITDSNNNDKVLKDLKSSKNCNINSNHSYSYYNFNNLFMNNSRSANINSSNSSNIHICQSTNKLPNINQFIITPPNNKSFFGNASFTRNANNNSIEQSSSPSSSISSNKYNFSERHFNSNNTHNYPNFNINKEFINNYNKSNFNANNEYYNSFNRNSIECHTNKVSQSFLKDTESKTKEDFPINGINQDLNSKENLFSNGIKEERHAIYSNNNKDSKEINIRIKSIDISDNPIVNENASINVDSKNTNNKENSTSSCESENESDNINNSNNEIISDNFLASNENSDIHSENFSDEEKDNQNVEYGYLLYVFHGNHNPNENYVFRNICMRYGLQSWDEMKTYLPWRTRADLRLTLMKMIKKQAIGEYNRIRADPEKINIDNFDLFTGEYQLKGGMWVNQKWNKDSSEKADVRKTNKTKYNLTTDEALDVNIPNLMNVNFIHRRMQTRKRNLLLYNAALYAEKEKRSGEKHVSRSFEGINYIPHYFAKSKSMKIKLKFSRDLSKVVFDVPNFND